MDCRRTFVILSRIPHRGSWRFPNRGLALRERRASWSPRSMSESKTFVRASGFYRAISKFDPRGFASASSVWESAAAAAGCSGEEVRRGRHPPSESISCSAAPTSSFRLQVNTCQFSLSLLSLASKCVKSGSPYWRHRRVVLIISKHISIVLLILIRWISISVNVFRDFNDGFFLCDNSNNYKW